MIKSSFSPYRLIFGNLSVGSSLRPIHYRTSRNYYSQNNFIPSIPPRFLVRILVSSRMETGSGRGSERARARREKRKRRNSERGESARTPTRRNPSPVALHKGYPLNLSVRYAPLRFSGFAENRALETEAAARTETKACSLVRSPLEAHPRREEFAPCGSALPLIVRQRWIAGLRGKSNISFSLSPSLPTRSGIHFESLSKSIPQSICFTLLRRTVLFIRLFVLRELFIITFGARAAPLRACYGAFNPTPPIVEKPRTRGNCQALCSRMSITVGVRAIICTRRVYCSYASTVFVQCLEECRSSKYLF